MNIYVGNIAHGLTESELHDMFTAFGKVSSTRLITDKFTGQPRGFAFVEMPEKEEAQKAIDSLNGKDVNGRALTVNEARPKTDNRSRGQRSGFGGGFGSRNSGFGGKSGGFGKSGGRERSFGRKRY